MRLPAWCRVLVCALPVLAMFAASPSPAQAQQGGVVVVALRVGGDARVTVDNAREVLPDGRLRPLTLARDALLAAGVEIEVPARTVVVLRSDAGNEVELGAGARFRVESTGAGGEWYTLLAGRVALRVSNALNFFNVDFGSFVARVRGTEFELDLGRDRSGAARVHSGAVSVQRERPTRIGDGQPVLAMAANERLDAARRPSARWIDGEGASRYASAAAAREHYRGQLADAERGGDLDTTMCELNNLGLVEMAAGQPAAAREYFQRLLDLAQRRGDEPWRARALDRLADADIRLQRWSDARVSLQAALAIERMLAPAGAARRIAWNEDRLAMAWRRLGRADEARAAQLRAMEIRRRLGGPRANRPVDVDSYRSGAGPGS